MFANTLISLSNKSAFVRKAAISYGRCTKTSIPSGETLEKLSAATAEKASRTKSAEFNHSPITRNFHSSAFSENNNNTFSSLTTFKRSLSQSSESSTSSCSSVDQENILQLAPVPLWLQASDLYQTMLRSGIELHADSFELQEKSCTEVYT